MESKFEIWKEHEAIAMHFNDLIIQLRTRALAGIGVIAAIVGFTAKGSGTEEFKWELLSGSFYFLAVVWFAIFLLDYCYYTRMLMGAVNEVIRLEETEGDFDIKMSIGIRNSVSNALPKNRHFWPILAFYTIVGSALVGGGIITGLNIK